MEHFALPKLYDVVVVGGGHAGVEAALAASRIGAQTLLLTQNLDTIAQMSCNPAIGGSAKGQIVTEIDALGGEMGMNADATGIHFRMLNASKGQSVRGLRAQCDKKAYQFRMKWLLERQPNLDIKQGSISEILLKGSEAVGVRSDFGFLIHAHSVVVTAGTFLRGLLHIGDRTRIGGRMSEASSSLSDNLRDMGFVTGRFKTGTPCRLDARSINFLACQEQLGDQPPRRFSYLDEIEPLKGSDFFTANSCKGGQFHVEQLPCWITETTQKTHDIIRRNLKRSALFSGRVEGVGPRYCPSIEDKVVKFADKRSHSLFLEPEGRQTQEFYVNGASTSLPFDVQLEFIRSIPGLNNAEIMRPGYAVEYDFFPPTQLLSTLETKHISRLYFAGQINGTSGYEEAAAQGLVAGANAALNAGGRPPLIIDRSEAYIGVLIDDLVTQGTQEPYRMFTSRAEHRLLLRHNNADQRLTKKALQFGLVGGRRIDLLDRKLEQLQVARETIKGLRVGGASLLQMLKRNEFGIEQLSKDIRERFRGEIWELLETEIKYEGYVRRHYQQLDSTRRAETVKIPLSIDYAEVPGLRNEARQQLARRRPGSVGQARRISGVTPSDIGILALWLTKPHKSFE